MSPGRPGHRSAAEAVRAEDVGWLRVEDDTAPGTVRRRAVELARRMGLQDTGVEHVAIVATELATNLTRHARQGVVALRVLRRGGLGGSGDIGGLGGVEIVSVDSGPGMRDVRALFDDGASTRGSLGIGLGTLPRLAHGYDVHSVPGHGTVVVATFWADGRSVGPQPAGLSRVFEGETECGDAYAFRPVADGWLVLAVDGLGHGPLAARAAEAATRAFRESPEVSPRALMDQLQQATARTRGAAAAVGHLDLDRGRLSYVAIGNIAGRLVAPRGSRGLVTHPGIVGQTTHIPAATAYDLEPGSWLVLHSDGLTEKWDLDTYPGIREHSPLLVAATLMRDAGVRRDDASVLTLKVVDP